MSVLSVRWEEKEIASSGADVPNASIVRPIIAVGTFKFFASEEAPETKKSAHFINKINPNIDNTICNSISFLQLQ